MSDRVYIINVAEMPEASGRSVKSFPLSRAIEIGDELRRAWGEYLTPSFQFKVTQNEKFWKIVATEGKEFRRSAYLKIKNTHEQRLLDAFKGLITDYFLYTGDMPVRWGTR